MGSGVSGLNNKSGKGGAKGMPSAAERGTNSGFDFMIDSVLNSSDGLFNKVSSLTGDDVTRENYRSSLSKVADVVASNTKAGDSFQVPSMSTTFTKNADGSWTNEWGDKFSNAEVTEMIMRFGQNSATPVKFNRK